MITPRDIVTHLRTYLPMVTDQFHDELVSTSAVVSGGSVTVTAPAHGLAIGAKVFIYGGEYENSLASVSLDLVTGIARFETVDEHDLVDPTLPADPQTLVLDGIGAPWDGVHRIEGIPNRESFEIAIPLGETLPPIITTGVLVEARTAGLDGVQEIATVPDVNTFTFLSPAEFPLLPNGDAPGLKITTGVRVVGAADYARAEAVYARQADLKPYAFVIMSDASVSKDRHSLNDAVATFSAQNFQKQTVLQNFTVACFFPTAANDTTGFNAQSIAYSEIYTALVNTLYGFQFEDDTSALNYVVVANGHGPGVNSNNTAYYAHVYDWQAPTVITFDTGFSGPVNVALRNINATWDLFDDDMAQLTNEIDLDEEPLP